MKFTPNPSSTEKVLNIISFLPYFFAVEQNVKTFFAPWKGIVALSSISQSPTFSQKLSINLTARFIGAICKSALLLAYIFCQLLLILFLPFILLFFLLEEKLGTLLHRQNHLANKIEEDFKTFCARHDPKQNFLEISQKWYEYKQKSDASHAHPLALESLFKIPPLAKNWNYAYTPTLDRYASDLTIPKSHWDHLLDRNLEVSKIETILSSSQGANMVLYGETGIGKHTIIEAFCRKLYYNHSNPLLAHKKVYKLDLSLLLEGTIDHNERALKLEKVLHEAESAKNIILLLDNFTDFINPKKSQQDFTPSFLKFLDSSYLHFIALCDRAEYTNSFTSNQKIFQKFVALEVEQVGKETQQEILFDLCIQTEKSAQITTTSEVLQILLEKSNNILSSIPMPELAIKIFHEAISVCKNTQTAVLDKSILNQILSQYSLTDMPSESMIKKLKNLESLLKKEVMGQEDIIQSVCTSIQRAYLAPNKHIKPIASFLFLGPTGVGKTLLAKLLATHLFLDQTKLYRFDMSNFQTLEAIASLLGNKSSSELGLLTSAIKASSGGIILLDEIEKSPQQILNIFLSILDEGYFTDLLGNIVNCRNHIIIATSNALAHELSQNDKISKKEYLNKLSQERIFSEEFLARFDEVLIFNPLSLSNALDIAIDYAQNLSNIYASTHHQTLTLTPQEIEQYLSNHFDPQYGARDIKKNIDTLFTSKFSTQLLEK